ncbi:MAG TPA: hypothetical protein VM513_36615 [Kofleriaceae bacterium]|nr:hypothetical protein [Kofleriaceae bacterium]
MMISKAALLFAVCACSSSSSTPSASGGVASTPRAPALIRNAGDGTLISRQLLSMQASAEVQRAVEQATPARETIELPFKSTDAPARVVLYRAAAPAHGIVFYGGAISDKHRESIVRLLASRGYHVVLSDMLELYVVNAELAAWAMKALGELPIACVDVHRCKPDRDPRAGSAAPAGALPHAAAIVDDDVWPTDLCHAGCAGSAPELVLVGPPGRLLTAHDEIRTRCAEKRERTSAVVTGVTFRGKPDLRDIGEFAVIEAFLAQHLGGRAESLDFAELRHAGLRVTNGLDHVTALADHHDLELAPLDEAARAELTSGFAELLGSVRGAVARGCPGLADRLEQLPVPETLVRYCQSDELQLLANRFQDDVLGAIVDAGCEEDALDVAPCASEPLAARCER